MHAAQIKQQKSPDWGIFTTLHNGVTDNRTEFQEPFFFRRAQIADGGQFYRHGIDVFAVLDNFIVQMRAR